MSGPSLSSTHKLTLLNSTTKIPVYGYGVYRISPSEATECSLNALNAGYRLIDTAQLYGNESEIGAAISQSGLPREDIFVTTKIRYPRLGKGKTYQRLLESVHKIDPREDGYVDLFLIHSPYALKPKERKEIWLAMEQLQKDGRVKAIGVSNYAVEHLEEMKAYATMWPPAVNQILVRYELSTSDYAAMKIRDANLLSHLAAPLEPAARSRLVL
jgi:diketogulonate reductase-like aldo/keto reductase